MKTETTPITDEEEAWREVQELLGVSCVVSRRLERSRRRNIRRAWMLRKEERSNRSEVAYWNERCAILAEQFNKITDQRDRAIQIAQEALSDGHRYPCYADEREPTIRCRCGWREETARLEKLNQEIECN